MREPRNPFRLRRAESIDTDTAFLGLFEPGILEVILSVNFQVSYAAISRSISSMVAVILRI